MNSWDILGIFAGVIGSFGFIPQIVRGFRTKHLDDLSYFMMIFLGSGMLLWLIYGIHINNVPIMLTNIVGVILNIILIVMKYMFSRNQHS